MTVNVSMCLVLPLTAHLHVCPLLKWSLVTRSLLPHMLLAAGQQVLPTHCKGVPSGTE